MVSANKNASNKRYDNKTYKQVTLRLRKEDDAELIHTLEFLNDKGISKREWLTGLCEAQGGYTKEQIVKVFDGFRGTLTPEIIERMLNDIER